MILSIDFGTSSLKAALLDNDFNTVQSTQQEYSYILKSKEKIEMDPQQMLCALKRACADLDANLLAKVELFCYDTYSPSLVLMDEEGTPLYPIVTHLDRRSREQSVYIDRVFGKESYQSITGVFPFNGGVSLTTLLWFMQEMPELMKSVYKIGHLPTYFQKLFTGTWAVDMVNASMMGLYDTLRQTGWSDELIKAFGIDRRWLSPIYVPGTATGGLLPNIAELMRVSAGIPVAMGTNDMSAAQIGARNTSAGQSLNTAGSSDMISILTDKPITNPRYYLRNSATPGIWQIYATTSGGFSIDWFYKEFCSEMEFESFLNHYIPKCIQLCDNNPVTFDPYLAEDRQDMERKTASWKGLTLSSTREQMLASLLYSMQNVLKDTVNEAEKSIRINRTLKVTGGMVSESILSLKRRIFDGYDFQIHHDCNILGNALLAQTNMDADILQAL